MITTLTFDLDDTLWSTRDVIGRAEAELFDFMDAEFPVFTQHHSVESFAEVRQQLIQADPRRVHDLRQLRLDALRLEIARLGHPDPDPLANQASAHFQRARQAVRFWPGVLNTLETLARSYQLIALTNGTTDIMASPAGEFFTQGYRADQFDAGKPEPDMFVHAMQEHDFRADQVVHVGDNWEHDVLAPHQMGWKTAWIGTEKPPGPQATLVLKSVNELPEKLTQL